MTTLQLQDIYDVLTRDINALMPNTTQLSKDYISSFLTSSLSKKYNGTACFFHETDWDHHIEYFLSDIEGLDFKVNDRKKVSVEARINTSGRCTDGYDGIFYQLVDNKIKKEDLEKMMKYKPSVLGYATDHKSPLVQVVPRANRYLDEFVYLIRDSQDFVRHTF
jgi:hypothetical protein